MAIQLILSRLDRTEVDPLEVTLAVLKQAIPGVHMVECRASSEREQERGREWETRSFALSPFPQPLAYLSAHLSLRSLLSERLKHVILKLY